MLAGWKGLFAIEYEGNAFETLRRNLLDGVDESLRYEWPRWLPKRSMDMAGFYEEFGDELRKLRGKVDLIAGGPPCQGFSFAGLRREDDRRNQLIRHYLQVVSLVRPKFLLIENVQGIAVEFGKKPRREKLAEIGRVQRASIAQGSFAERIQQQLTSLGYEIQAGVMRAADVGVPQKRPRFIMLGMLADLAPPCWSKDAEEAGGGRSPFSLLEVMRSDFLCFKKWDAYERHGRLKDIFRPVRAGEALSDLETRKGILVECTDDTSRSGGFRQLRYKGPGTPYQEILHEGCDGAPNSMRLARHRPATIERYQLALDVLRKGVTLSDAEKRSLGMMKKHQFKILHRDLPSHTLTTLPDDLLHYSEPRILTVREYARLQSFPDWFAFHGKYTTGGEKRATEAPRYTQVGNAVPPFMAELLGWLLLSYHTELVQPADGVAPITSKGTSAQEPALRPSRGKRKRRRARAAAR